MREFLTEILLGFFVIGWLLLYWHHCGEIRKLKADLAELVGEVDNNSSRVAAFSKFIDVVHEADKRNGHTA